MMLIAAFDAACCHGAPLPLTRAMLPRRYALSAPHDIAAPLRVTRYCLPP